MMRVRSLADDGVENGFTHVGSPSTPSRIATKNVNVRKMFPADRHCSCWAVFGNDANGCRPSCGGSQPGLMQRMLKAIACQHG